MVGLTALKVIAPATPSASTFFIVVLFMTLSFLLCVPA
jgi:hypothetical protein